MIGIIDEINSQYMSQFYGPLKLFKHVGWVCIPLIFPLATRYFAVNPYGVLSRKFMGVEISSVAVLCRAPVSVAHTLREPSYAGLLEAVASHLFLASGSPPRIEAIRFQHSFPPDVTFMTLSGKKVSAHSTLLRARLQKPQMDLSPGAIVALPFTAGLVRRALHFLYTGDIARLVGWFDTATQQLIGDSSIEDFVKPHIGPAHDTARMRRVLLLGALPFFLFAEHTRARGLMVACIDYAAETIMRLPAHHKPETLARLIAQAPFDDNEYFAERFLQAIGSVTPGCVDEVRSMCDGAPKRVQRFLRTQFRFGLIVQHALPRQYTTREYSKFLKNEVQLVESSRQIISRSFGEDFTSMKFWQNVTQNTLGPLKVQTRPEIERARFGTILPQGSCIPLRANIISGKRDSMIESTVMYPIVHALMPDGKRTYVSGAEIIPLDTEIVFCAEQVTSRRYSFHPNCK